MGERIELARLAPQRVVLPVLEVILDDLESLMGFHVIDHRGASFERVDIILCPVGMYVGRLG